MKQQGTACKYVTSIELIHKRGYDHVTVNDICETCGITKGAFYHHFNSKEDDWCINEEGYNKVDLS